MSTELRQCVRAALVLGVVLVKILKSRHKRSCGGKEWPCGSIG